MGREREGEGHEELENEAENSVVTALARLLRARAAIAGGVEGAAPPPLHALLFEAFSGCLLVSCRGTLVQLYSQITGQEKFKKRRDEAQAPAALRLLKQPPPERHVIGGCCCSLIQNQPLQKCALA